MDTVSNRAWIVYILIGVVITTTLFIYIHDTNKMTDLAKQAKRQNLSTGYVFDTEPFLGGEVSLIVDDSDKTHLIAYRVVNDRYSKTVVDLNKSRIVGEYVGSKTKQFLKGLVSGKEDTNKHDE